jgi:hypothetical protein
MTNDDGRKPEGASERSPKVGAGVPSGVDGNGPKRLSIQRKMTNVVSRARRFVWAQDISQQRFVENRISTKLEPTPLFPNIGRYEPPAPSATLPGVVVP